MNSYLYLIPTVILFANACGSKSSLSGDGATGNTQVKSGNSSPVISSQENATLPPAAKSVVPERAVQAGSFQAWLEPPDPAPFQEYEIWIKVNLPDQYLDGYSIKDLSGTVAGTDDYRAAFGASFGIGTFEKLSDGAIFHIGVPGGGRFVNDTVQVQSLILKENQVLKLSF